MSFILDALKKSETDRQRQNGPALFEVRMAPPKTGLPLWAIGLGVLLAVNLVIVAWVLLHKSSAPDTAQSGSSGAAPAGYSGPPGQGGYPGQQGGYAGPQGGGPQGGTQGYAGQPGYPGQPGYAGPQGYPPQGYPNPNYSGQAGAGGQQGYPSPQAGPPGQQAYAGGGYANAGSPGQGYPPGINGGQQGQGYPGANGAAGYGGAPGYGQVGPNGPNAVPVAGSPPTGPVGQTAGMPPSGGQYPSQGAPGAANEASDAGNEKLNPDDYAPAADPGPTRPFANGVSKGTSAGVPLYRDAAAQPGSNIPPLRLDFHVFAPKPQDRFVMINMHKLHEGDSTPEGVRVEDITAEGAVLSKDGVRFLLTQ